MIGEHHILNLYLQKGTIPVFLEVTDKFFSIIQREIVTVDKVAIWKFI